MVRRTAAVLTLGCKLNLADSEEIAHGLRGAGFDVVDHVCEADAYVINTCSVTHVADAKSRKLIRSVRRLSPGAKAFSPQQDLMGDTTALDGGASIAANEKGNVAVVWHAAPAGEEGEVARLVWVRHSADDGRTFLPPAPLNAPAVSAQVGQAPSTGSR